MTTARSKRRQARCRCGLSLAEVVVSTLLVGLVIVASMNGVGGVLLTWRVAAERHSHEGLARQLMSEILQQRYQEPTDPPQFGIESPESSLDRSAWDDVDDYNGWSSAPQDKNGTALVDYTSWNRSVAVNYVTLNDPTAISGADVGLKRITVTVTNPTGRQLTLVAYRSQWGALEQSPQADSTMQTWVGSRLQVGQGSAKLESGVQLPNHARD